MSNGNEVSKIAHIGERGRVSEPVREAPKTGRNTGSGPKGTERKIYTVKSRASRVHRAPEGSARKDRKEKAKDPAKITKPGGRMSHPSDTRPENRTRTLSQTRQTRLRQMAEKITQTKIPEQLWAQHFAHNLGDLAFTVQAFSDLPEEGQKSSKPKKKSRRSKTSGFTRVASKLFGQEEAKAQRGTPFKASAPAAFSQVRTTESQKEEAGQKADRKEKSGRPAEAAAEKDGHREGQKVQKEAAEGTQITEKGHRTARLSEISEVHGRAFAAEAPVLWKDRHGRLFMRIGTKGNNLQKPILMKTDAGYEVFGLQDSSQVERNKRVSEVLGDLGVVSETLIGVSEPTELPINGKNVSIPRFKAHLLRGIRRRVTSSAYISEVTGRPEVTAEEIPAVRRDLRGKRFVTTVRASQTHEELADFTIAAYEGRLGEVLGPALEYANLDTALQEGRSVNEELKEMEASQRRPRETAMRRRLYGRHRLFSPDDPDSVAEFFNDYLPRQMASNSAKMHRGGLVFGVHDFTSVGTIKDLDGVKGEPLGLGDEVVTSDETIRGLNGILQGVNGFPAPADTVRKAGGDPDKFTETFLRQYFHDRGWEVSAGTIDFIKELYTSGKHRFDGADYFNYIADQVVFPSGEAGEAEVFTDEVLGSREVIMTKTKRGILDDYAHAHPDQSEFEKHLIEQLSSNYAEGAVQNGTRELYQAQQNEKVKTRLETEALIRSVIEGQEQEASSAGEPSENGTDEAAAVPVAVNYRERNSA